MAKNRKQLLKKSGNIEYKNFCNTKDPNYKNKLNMFE